MSESLKRGFTIPPEQEVIRDKCFHPAGTFVEFPREDVEQSIPERFEKIVRMYPEQLAVKMGDRALTYDELNQAANRIACAVLEKRGSAVEPVVLLFEHGIDVITAILGVLKSGKFYVAMDFSFPKETAQHILKDSTATLVITKECDSGRARTLIGPEPELLDLDKINGASPTDNLGLSVTADNLAAIFYTSGSTGNPKGVIHTHRSYILGALENIAPQAVTAGDRLSLLHSLSFKSATSHLVLSLMRGACLVLYDLKSQGVGGISDWLRRERITLFHLPPAVFRAFSDTLHGHDQFPDLRRICLSGSVVTALEFESFRDKIGRATLLEVAMGCTEVGWATVGILHDTFVFPEEGNPIGYAYGAKKILVLDEDGHEVQQGAVGEIAVKSPYLSPGYWQNPELTQTKFLADPKGGNERIFLTGDLGQMMPDGLLIHRGRKDFMVKIRGYRIEIGEIERVLLSHPLLKDAGVVAWDRESDEKYLVAYIVAQTNPVPRIEELRAFTREKLPDHMIPSAFMYLETLPLINGKLDRAALPKPEGKRPDLSQPYVAPRNAVERELVEIWAEVLSLDQIGIHDNFFDLGGHSLAATRIISHVLKRFQLDILLRSLFESPTVAQMAQVVAEYRGKQISNAALEGLLREVEAMSEEEAQRLLADNGIANGRT